MAIEQHQNGTKEIIQTIIKCYQAVWRKEPALEKLIEISETCNEASDPEGPHRSSTSLNFDERMIARDIYDHIEDAIEDLQK